MKPRALCDLLFPKLRRDLEAVVMVMVMVINSALVRTHQSTYSGSFGPVLLPRWLGYTRSAAVPQDVEGLTRPPHSRRGMPTSSPGSRCCIIKPLLAVG